ncbi:hypothetical protein Ae201684_013337 [Aphanomyces euteiches]|uniref:Protein kinase domain-containing protein n=1 Tax=Aphanomyces euteiches TaxID=100861 RepID=A0A6G0WNV2_9STRA|nr:hypothetical protein Ae201684_013337 [Aphanomyces euteiches]
MAAAKCIYEAFPPSINIIAVWRTSLCASASASCFVNRSCVELPKPIYLYDAVGDYSDSPQTSVLSLSTRSLLFARTLQINGRGPAVDWSMFVSPANLTNLTLTHFPQIELSPNFQWPPRLVSLSIVSVDNMTWPNTSQVPRLIELNIDKSSSLPSSFPASVKSLHVLSSNLTEIPSQLPPLLTSLALDGNPITTPPTLLPTLTSLSIASTAITSLDKLDLTNLALLDISSTPFRTITNATFSSKLDFLNLTNVTLENWEMDQATFNAINRNDIPTLGLNESLADVTVTLELSNTICSDSTASYVWKTLCKSKFQSCNDCLGQDPIEDVSSTNYTNIIVGATGGAVVCIGLLIWWICRRRDRIERAVKSPRQMNSTWTDAQTIEMTNLAVFRVPERELELGNLLGAGAFANVWRGTFRGNAVAVKVLQDHRLDHVQAFVDEIQLVGKLKSPSIVKLIGVTWTSPVDLKCILEFMDCGNLRDYLAHHNSQVFPWNDKLPLIYNIIEGLVYLHSLNIIHRHRGIKSRNILLDSTKGTKLTDFGISKEDIQAMMTVGIGTFRWMAPEVIQSQYYTTAADVYSFGVVLS